MTAKKVRTRCVAAAAFPVAPVAAVVAGAAGVIVPARVGFVVAAVAALVEGASAESPGPYSDLWQWRKRATPNRNTRSKYLQTEDSPRVPVVFAVEGKRQR